MHGAVCAGNGCWRCQQRRADALVIIDILDRLGTWLGHLGHSSRCAAQGLVLKSQCGDRSGGGDGEERRKDERGESSFSEFCILASVSRFVFCGCWRVRRAACQCRSTFVAVVGRQRRAARMGVGEGRSGDVRRWRPGCSVSPRVVWLAGALMSQPRSRLEECVVLASGSDRGTLRGRCVRS